MMPVTHGVIASGYTASGDPHFANVKALLHFDGADASTTFTDVIGNTWTANGNAQIDTAQSKFGGASGLFDGSGDYLTTSYSTSSFDWWVGSYTIEFWVRASSWSGWSYDPDPTQKPVLLSNRATGTDENYWSFGPLSNGALAMYYYNGSANTVKTTTTMSTGAWHHIAMTTDGTDILLFIDGTLEITAAISGTPQSSAGVNLVMGRGHNGSVASHINGWLDDARITKGTQRYTGNFTIPTAAFPDS